MRARGWVRVCGRVCVVCGCGCVCVSVCGVCVGVEKCVCVCDRLPKSPSTGPRRGEYPFARLINKHLRFIRRTGSTRKLTGSISGSAGCFSPGSLHRGFFLSMSRVCASEVSGRADPADFPEAPRKHTGSTPGANTPDVTDDPEWVGGRAGGGDMSAPPPFCWETGSTRKLPGSISGSTGCFPKRVPAQRGGVS